VSLRRLTRAGLIGLAFAALCVPAALASDHPRSNPPPTPSPRGLWREYPLGPVKLHRAPSATRSPRATVATGQSSSAATGPEASGILLFVAAGLLGGGLAVLAALVLRFSAGGAGPRFAVSRSPAAGVISEPSLPRLAWDKVLWFAASAAIGVAIGILGVVFTT
jgi:hypothetical protein